MNKLAWTRKARILQAICRRQNHKNENLRRHFLADVKWVNADTKQYNEEKNLKLQKVKA